MPQLTLPAGACDAHVHVFGPGTRFPYDPARGKPPVDAPKEQLFALHRRLGIQRCIVVQSLVHGSDHRAVEDVIAAGGGRYLGVAILSPNVPDAELQRLADVGFRGVRFRFLDDEVRESDAQTMLDFAERLRPLDMHIQVHLHARHIHRLKPALARSPVPVVVDHIGRVDASLGAEHSDFRGLHALLRNSHCHVKVSGVDRITRDGAYASGAALAALLVRDYPAQCVWGTDWPHPNHDHVPDDGALVDLIAQIAPDAMAVQRLLVDNPKRLYRFGA